MQASRLSRRSQGLHVTGMARIRRARHLNPPDNASDSTSDDEAEVLKQTRAVGLHYAKSLEPNLGV